MSEKLAYVYLRCSSIFGEGISKVLANLSQKKHDYSKEFYSDEFMYSHRTERTGTVGASQCLNKSLHFKMCYHISTTLLHQTNVLSDPSVRELDSNLAFKSKGSTRDKTLSWTGPRTLHDVR